MSAASGRCSAASAIASSASAAEAGGHQDEAGPADVLAPSRLEEELKPGVRGPEGVHDALSLRHLVEAHLAPGADVGDLLVGEPRPPSGDRLLLLQVAGYRLVSHRKLLCPSEVGPELAASRDVGGEEVRATRDKKAAEAPLTT